tara:strand:+ start:18266 stop:18508 length:243 start_codon:yes stop_codon:yes gene_type:complete
MGQRFSMGQSGSCCRDNPDPQRVVITELKHMGIWDNILALHEVANSAKYPRMMRNTALRRAVFLDKVDIMILEQQMNRVL